MPTITSVTQYFPRAVEGFTTTLANTISAGATTMQLNSTAGYSIGDVIVLLIEPGGTNEQAFTGTVAASNTITNVVWTKGTNNTHNAGVTLVDYTTSTGFDMVTVGILKQHNQDGSHGAITATSVTASGVINTTGVGQLQDNGTALTTTRTETQFDYIASGGVWSGLGYGSNLNGAMTALVAYQNGQRITVAAVASRTFTASQDTYIDLLNTAGVGSLVYTTVANNAASPALAANSIRLAIVVTGTTSIAAVGSINQGQENIVLPIVSGNAYAVTDSLGNLICPRDPSRKLLGYRAWTANVTAGGGLTTTVVSVPVIVPTGRKVQIDVYGRDAYNGTAGQYVGVGVVDVTGSAQIGGLFIPGVNANGGVNPATSAIHTPPTTSRTYSFTVSSPGTGTVTLEAGVGYPGVCRVTLI